MQESLLSLMQMAKTNAMLTRLSAAGLPFISVLTDPTMGGVSASFAFMGDVVIAEPKALIGFAGPRVIEQTVREKLPEGFQRAEFLLQKGAIDMVVDRRQLREEIARLLALLNNQPADGGGGLSADSSASASAGGLRAAGFLLLFAFGQVPVNRWIFGTEFSTENVAAVRHKSSHAARILIMF